MFVKSNIVFKENGVTVGPVFQTRREKWVWNVGIAKV